jgi:ABC-type nitrate/sulfonate/bicarbonate transport system ATPase subunit
MFTGEVLLSLRDVSLQLGGSQILRGVSFDVYDRVRPDEITGQIVGLLGPSGVGKTRLLRIIAGLEPSASGEVTGPLSVGHAGFVFQEYPLLRHRTVRRNLLLSAELAGLSAKEAATRCDELLSYFDLSHRAEAYPAQLSGGQRQRAAIAQQLIQGKKLLLLDEPFSGLDPSALEDVLVMFRQVVDLNQENTILLVTHDIRTAMIACDTLLLLGREGDTPGAFVRETIDLVEEGIAWKDGIESTPGFAVREQEIRASFRSL